MSTNRVAQRVTMNRRVICIIGNVAALVQMYDLSHDGCMITAPDATIDAGDELVIELFEEMEVRGTVAWRDAGHIGIAFAERVHPVIVQQMGFHQPAPSFSSKKPRDPFGQRLAAALKVAGGRGRARVRAV